MNRLKIIYIGFLIISLLFSEEKSWTTTTFEYYWNSGFNRIRFREPVNFSPFEARAGYLTYGGSDYWDNLMSTDLGDISPVILDRTNNSFEYLKPDNSRMLAFIEFDFMKFNFPNFIFRKIGWSQNIIDIQTGLGYRYIHSISEPELPDYWNSTNPNNQNLGTLLFKPKLHDFNINTTIDYQPLEKFRVSLYHSLGYLFGTIYEYSGAGTYLGCEGISESFGLGLKYVRTFEKYNFNLIYGIEARFHRAYIDKIEDPSEISHIIGLDMYSKGLIFSIGTIFGGQKTSADYSFLKMLNEDYISAEPGFENYINNIGTPPRKKLAKKMLEFTQTQIPYQQYKNGLKHQYLGDLDSAIYWFNQSEKLADSELLFEINTHKRDLAIMLIDSVNIYKSEMTFKMAEKIILKARKLSDDYYYVNEMLSNLYIEKGDALENVGNFSKAYIFYNKAKQTYPDSKVKLIEKYHRLTDSLMREAGVASKMGDYSFAIESLNFALDLSPNKQSHIAPIIDDLYSKLSLEESKKIKQRIKDVVENKKNEIKNSMNKKILVGMSSNEVKNAIGLPIIKDMINQGDRVYELWTYNNRPNLSRVYFEENLVIKVE